MARDPWDLSRETSYPPRPRSGDGGRGAGSYGRDPSAPPRGEARPRRRVDDGARVRGDAQVPRRADGSRVPGGPRPRRGAEGAPASGEPRPGRGGDPRQVRIGFPPDAPSGGRRTGSRHVHPGGPDGHDPGGTGRRRRKRSWPQRLVLGAGLALVVFCMLGASVAGYTLVKYQSIDRVGDLGDLPSAADGEPENFLIVAVDTREGQNSRNTDTIMVVRVDPNSDRLALTSFPRDLLVTIADTGETGMINSAYARDSGGEQVLIDTLRQNFDITINHFIEVNFESFKQVVDSVGGVSLWLETAARDKGSAFYSEDLGCVNLDGTRGLQFVRARKLEILTEDGWQHDPLSDVNRVKRQQIFIQRAMAKVLSQVKSNPLRLQELVDIGVSNVALDPNLGIGDIVDLANHFEGFDPAKLETYPLPVTPYEENENRLVLNEAEAEPVLNVFRGLAPGEIRPGLINVTVLNGTVADPAQQRQGLATDVSGALQQVGFKLAAPDDADAFYPQTTIEYAPGQEAYAQRVARHVSGTTAIPTVENPDLAPTHVTLIAGLDFTTVHEQPTPIDAMPAPAGALPPAGSEAPADTTVTPGDTTTTTPAPPPVTPETENPFIIGAVPENADC